jgi:uncharacterized membrane protein
MQSTGFRNDLLQRSKTRAVAGFIPFFSRLLPVFFILVALPSTLMLTMLVPYGEVADEPTHAGRALALCHAQFIGHRVSENVPTLGPIIDSGVSVDRAIVLAATKPMNGSIMETADALSHKHRIPWLHDNHFMSAPPLAIYAPIFYIPGAIGIDIARHLYLSPYHAGLFGRLADSFVYLVLGATALAVARRAQAVFLAVLILPMSLNLAASLNQDSLIIATSVLAAALISRSWHDLPPGGSMLSLPTTWAAAAALLCIAIVKPPYVVLAAVLLLPSQAWFQAVRQKRPRKEAMLRIALVATVALITVVWFVWDMEHVSALIYFWPPRPVGPLLKGIHAATLDHTSPALQLQILLAKPIRVFTLPLSTFAQNPLWTEMVGVLGWLDIVLPNPLYNLWYDAALLACLAALLTPRAARGWHAAELCDSVLILLFVFLTFILIYISQFLDWTNVGNAFIEGPQGRYLLPLLPFIGLAIPRIEFPGSAWLQAALTCLVVVPGIIGLAVLPGLMLQAYYLH